MPKIHFLPADVTVEVKTGTALLDAALDNNIHLDHNCGGNCACSTCHIIVEEGFESLNKMTEDEMDMLDEAEGLTKTSRLSCQALVADKDLKVIIPNKDVKWDDDTF
jgi:2Fe-2S ferredoxin